MTNFTKRQKQIITLTKEAYSDIYGGYENQRDDNEPGSDEWNEANEALNETVEQKTEALYRMILNQADRSGKDNIRFEGETEIKALISKIVRKYEA